MLTDKDVRSVVAKLATRVDLWYCAGLGGPRGTSGPDLAAIVRQAIAATTAQPTLEETSTEFRRFDPPASGRPGVRSVAVPPVAARPIQVSSFETPDPPFSEAPIQAPQNDKLLGLGSVASVG